MKLRIGQFDANEAITHNLRTLAAFGTTTRKIRRGLQFASAPLDQVGTVTLVLLDNQQATEYQWRKARESAVKFLKALSDELGSLLQWVGMPAPTPDSQWYEREAEARVRVQFTSDKPQRQLELMVTPMTTDFVETATMAQLVTYVYMTLNVAHEFQHFPHYQVPQQ
ncbi:hypothetical protein [Achromobacter phage Motura]|uniref:Uncharacterized protein n=1 Tax=Achromobacter phage Motura TaxID=2591403 RepID=A0A514CSR5_9CAUD|nr:hypothetical protein H1O15_gp301 [Achromobacter phage Motura]QDH83505.1 hypothetical protein [Achromobacter phage Motura]